MHVEVTDHSNSLRIQRASTSTLIYFFESLKFLEVFPSDSCISVHQLQTDRMVCGLLLCQGWLHESWSSPKSWYPRNIIILTQKSGSTWLDQVSQPLGSLQNVKGKHCDQTPRRRSLCSSTIQPIHYIYCMLSTSFIIFAIKDAKRVCVVLYPQDETVNHT